MEQLEQYPCRRSNSNGKNVVKFMRFRPPSMVWESSAAGEGGEGGVVSCRGTDSPEPCSHSAVSVASKARGGSLEAAAAAFSQLSSPMPMQPSDCLTSLDVSTTTSQRLDSSTLNSLDYWDYSVELECLSGGPDGKNTFMGEPFVRSRAIKLTSSICFHFEPFSINN